MTPLPDTLKEAAVLETRAKKWQWPIKAYGGAGASEAQLAALQSPRVLHLAAHTFSLPDRSEAGGAVPQRAARTKLTSEPNTATTFSTGAPVPMNIVHRCGLVLAGGQATLKAWNRGEIPASSNDGIVTADEVGTLKLQGTELVVLSTGSVGIDGARSGKGSQSRARFVKAGAENLPDGFVDGHRSRLDRDVGRILRAFPPD